MAKIVSKQLRRESHGIGLFYFPSVFHLLSLTTRLLAVSEIGTFLPSSHRTVRKYGFKGCGQEIPHMLKLDKKSVSAVSIWWWLADPPELCV